MNTATSETRARPAGQRVPAARQVVPPVDIFEREQGFLIVADVPGVTPERLRVEYEPPGLHVRAEVPEQGLVYERRFELGSAVDPGSISAELKDGVLRISLGKSDALRSRRIEVRAS